MKKWSWLVYVPLLCGVSVVNASDPAAQPQPTVRVPVAKPMVARSAPSYRIHSGVILSNPAPAAVTPVRVAKPALVAVPAVAKPAGSKPTISKAGGQSRVILVAQQDTAVKTAPAAVKVQAPETKAPEAKASEAKASETKTDKPAAKATAEKPNPEHRFLRVTRDGKTPEYLQTSIIRYQSPQGAGGAVDPTVNKQSDDGNSPLHLAAQEGHLEVVKELLAKGARTDLENKQGLTPLHLAAKAGSKEIVAVLLAAKVPNGVTVDLISVVHIGEKEYYHQLNKEFEQYDALLYELVAPPNTKIPKDAAKRKPSSAVGMMQTGMTDVLDLDFQLHHVDYHKPNFVHADMSPDQFAKTMENRGESFTKMFFKSMGYGIAMQSKNGGKSNDLNVFASMFSPNRSLSMKRAMAQQFEDLDQQLDMFGGKDGSTIIHERNKVCLEVLQDQIKKGKTKIGIFYGAGHMVDMEERLIRDFKLAPTETRWLTAWDLRETKK